MSVARILIAEDDKDLAELVTVALSEKYQVTHVPDGESAYEKLKESKPDLTILDLSMPKLSGLEVLDKIRQDGGYEDMLVIIATASTQHTDLPDGFWQMVTRVDGFISKPFQIKELQELVENILRKRIDERQQ